MAEKSRDAFRTISEVADWLDVPTHVLRFWESRFSQIKPVKRAGGRRYYRPSDMRVIGGVKVLLHDQGMTIRGVQKLFREEGIKHVAGYAPELFGEDPDDDTVGLNEEALERAARPASAARATHDAEPDPDVSETEYSVETSEAIDALSDVEGATTGDNAPPIFRRARVASETPAATNAAATEPDPVPIARIPATPDVPGTDIADDDPKHSADMGVAARLKMASVVDLSQHRAALSEAAARLSALAARLE